MYNKNNESFDLLNRALEAEDIDKFKSLLKQSIALNNNNYEAKLHLMLSEESDMGVVIIIKLVN